MSCRIPNSIKRGNFEVSESSEEVLFDGYYRAQNCMRTLFPFIHKHFRVVFRVGAVESVDATMAGSMFGGFGWNCVSLQLSFN